MPIPKPKAIIPMEKAYQYPQLNADFVSQKAVLEYFFSVKVKLCFFLIMGNLLISSPKIGMKHPTILKETMMGLISRVDSNQSHYPWTSQNVRNKNTVERSKLDFAVWRCDKGKYTKWKGLYSLIKYIYIHIKVIITKTTWFQRNNSHIIIITPNLIDLTYHWKSVVYDCPKRTIHYFKGKPRFLSTWQNLPNKVIEGSDVQYCKKVCWSNPGWSMWLEPPKKHCKILSAQQKLTIFHIFSPRLHKRNTRGQDPPWQCDNTAAANSSNCLHWSSWRSSRDTLQQGTETLSVQGEWYS